MYIFKHLCVPSVLHLETTVYLLDVVRMSQNSEDIARRPEQRAE